MQAVEERQQVAKRRACADGPRCRIGLQRAPRARDLPRALEIAGCERVAQALEALAVGAEADTTSRALGTCSSTSGQAASSRSTPLLTISLPTNATSRSSAGRAARAPRPPRARRARRRRRPRLARRRRRRRSRASSGDARRRAANAPSSARAAAGSRGTKRSTSTPGGPSRVRVLSAGPRAPATGSPPCGGSRRACRAAPATPSRAYGRKRSGSGLTVYSSALPWTFTAYGTLPPSARARITGPITRWLASATSGETSSTSSRTAATFAST